MSPAPTLRACLLVFYVCWCLSATKPISLRNNKRKSPPFKKEKKGVAGSLQFLQLMVRKIHKQYRVRCNETSLISGLAVCEDGGNLLSNHLGSDTHSTARSTAG